jgi:hypothetical protein
MVDGESFFGVVEGCFSQTHSLLLQDNPANKVNPRAACNAASWPTCASSIVLHPSLCVGLRTLYKCAYRRPGELVSD